MNSIFKFKDIFRLIVIALILLTGPVLLKAQWVPTNGPQFGGYITCFASSGANLFAGTSRGVYHSTNNGANWRVVSYGLPPRIVLSLVLVINILFAATDQGIFRSVDNGENWTEVSSTALGDKTCFTFAVSGTNLYVGSEIGVYRSTNLGTNWISQNSGLPQGTDIRDLVFHGDFFFAGDHTHGVYRSTNNGSWTKVNTNLTDTSISSFAVSGTTLFAGTNNGVFRTLNYGTTWQKILNINNVSDVATNGQNVFAATFYSGIFRSTNSGTSWSSFITGLTSNVIPALLSHTTNLFAGTSNGVYRSTNNGNSAWLESNNGLTSESVYSIIAAGPNLYAGTNSKVYFSSNNGIAWNELSNNGLPTSNFFVRDMIVSGNNLLIASNTDVYLSTNYGLNWTASGLKSPNAFGILGNNLFVGTNIGVYLSTNNGLNWEHTGATIRANSFTNSDTILFASTYARRVYSSTNSGTNWSDITSNLLLLQDINALSFSGNSIYVGTDNGVFRSTNNGTNWIAFNTGLTSTKVYSFIASGTNLFAGTDDGIFRTTNYEATWTKINTGLTTSAYIFKLGVSATDLYAATFNGGVWRRPLSEVISVGLLSSEIPDQFNLSQNYPNPFNPVTTINFSIPSTSFVTLRIYNVMGKEVSRLVNEYLTVGSYSSKWDASNLPSGVYFYNINAGAFSDTKKLMLLK